jgi:2-dehydro-3-deoxyphosphogluconate aldolase/(4S)-4-hydroxy-2-oxoglutarate aldolase
LTLSTTGVIDRFIEFRERWGDGIDLGIGTVVEPGQCRDALDVGARFIVTPTMEVDVVRACVAAGRPVIPGGLTPTEVERGWRLGATAVKIFPAAVVGPGYVAHLRGPFPDMQVIPSGGVSLDDIVPWLRAGAMAVSVGGPLIGDAFSGGNLGALTERARRAIALAEQTVDIS